jgi:hypothetical protein
VKGYYFLKTAVVFFASAELYAASYDPLAVDPNFKARELS